MHKERRRSGTNLYPVYSSDEDEQMNYIPRNSSNEKRGRRSSSFRENTPVRSSEYRRKSLVGNKSNNSYLDYQAKGKFAGQDFDALYIPKAVITIVAGLAAGVFVATLSLPLIQHGEKPPQLIGDYLSCSNYKDANISHICIPESDIYIVLDTIVNLQRNLSTEAGLAECYPSLQNQANVSVNNLDKFTPQNSSVKDLLLMKYVAWIIVANPPWNLRLYEVKGSEINVSKYVVNKSWRIKSIHSIKPLSCTMWQWVRFLWYSMWYIILGILVVIICFYSYLWYVNKKRQQQQAVFIMVDKIIEVLMSHYKSSMNNKDLLPYLAISHVRDMLIPPSERVRREHIWKKAVDWIAKSDSRVRIESQMIAGEQFDVWKWIQKIDSTDTESPDRYEWQGKAFDAVSPPSCPPSLCMRLKNMFDSTIHMSPSDITAIQDSLLHKCLSCDSRVVHIIVDKRSLFGCVYMKLDSMSSALAVYKALHGSWFKGRLITAKYIAPERYHKWFPAAEYAVRTIYPSDT